MYVLVQPRREGLELVNYVVDNPITPLRIDAGSDMHCKRYELREERWTIWSRFSEHARALRNLLWYLWRNH